MRVCPECRATYTDDAPVCTTDGSSLVPVEAMGPVDVPLEPGTMVGEYRVDKLLGTGSFGEVYAGEQPLIGKRVAIKLLHRKLSSDATVVSRFIAEARAVNRIRHRNIIDIFSFGMLDGQRHYFVMELCDGMTLGALLDRERRLDPARAIPILRGVADALDAAHQADVTHRDLKPDNIFLVVEKDGSFFPKLLDFGIAKLVGDDAAHKTRTGMAMGTPRYMSPEQCRGKRVDHRADIYALGVVAHEMLTGHPVFEAESAMDLLFKHSIETPLPMSAHCPDLPPELDAPVLAMLAKRPNDRPASAGQAIAALAEQAIAAGALPSRPGDDAATVRQASPFVAAAHDGKRAGSSSSRAARVDDSGDRREAVTVPGGKRPVSSGSQGPTLVSAGNDAEVASAPTLIAGSTSGDGSTTGPARVRDEAILSQSAPEPSSSTLGGVRSSDRAPRPPARWPYVAAVAVAVAAGAFALAQSRSKPDATGVVLAHSAAAPDVPSAVTALPSVTPANTPTVVPSLLPLPTASAASSSSVPSARPPVRAPAGGPKPTATPRPSDDRDLDRPVEIVPGHK
jgi:eukaryotic-like serine/threonine-protein kinase